jgi:putative lipoprotein (rSAM/lipoprotein system)
MKLSCRISALAAILMMAASCAKEQIGDPYMLFEVHGKVMDTAGNPLAGIRVSSGTSDVQTTNANGTFVFYGRSVPTLLVVLTFEDKDGENNGGEFSNLSMEIAVNEKTPGSKDGNFKGTYFAGEVEVVMLKKNDQMNPDSGFIPLSAL